MDETLFRLTSDKQVIFNDTTNSQGILQDIDFICATNTATYSVADKTRNVNQWNKQVMNKIAQYMDEWDFQGQIATTTLTAFVQEYPFPSDIYTIKRVELDYSNDSVFSVANKFDPSTFDKSIANSASINSHFSQSDPYYDVYDNSVFTFPVPDASGGTIKIWYTESISDMTATAAGNTAQPAFHENFHRILSLGASLDYAKAKRIDSIIAYCNSELFGKYGLFEQLKEHYSARTGDKIMSLKSRYFNKNYK